MQECIKCQTFKTSNKYNIHEQKPIFATKPGQIITMDNMGPIPLANGKFKHILVICDHFTKYVEFFATKTVTALETAKKLVEYISRHGCPESILSDQGKNFQSELITELWELLDVHQLKTTAYHPQCNGQTERLNRTLQNMLANYINDKKDDWDEYLPLLQFAYNTAIHSTTKFSPFELTYGREPRMPLDLMHNNTQLELYLSTESFAYELQKQLAEAYEKVSRNTEVSVMPNKIRHDRNVRAASFAKNDFVWVLDTAKLKGISKKLSHRWKGPYKIVDVIDDANYKIKTLNGKRSLIVNKCKLKRCFERKILHQHKQNLETIDEAVEEENFEQMAIPQEIGIEKSTVPAGPDKVVELVKKLKKKKKKKIKCSIQGENASSYEIVQNLKIRITKQFRIRELDSQLELNVFPIDTKLFK